MAVTPRAFVRVIEMKPWNLNRDAARGAPAMVVAHLERWCAKQSEALLVR